MKSYRFRLQRLLDLRRRTLEASEAELARALAEARATDERAAALAREAATLAQQAASKSSWAGREMIAAERWVAALGEKRRQALATGDSCRARIGNLRQKLQEARVGVRVLETLDERRRREWRRASDLEEETTASELYLARWMRKNH